MRLSSLCTDLLNGYLIFDFNFYCFQIVDVSEDWQKEDKLARLLDEIGCEQGPGRFLDLIQMMISIQSHDFR